MVSSAWYKVTILSSSQMQHIKDFLHYSLFNFLHLPPESQKANTLHEDPFFSQYQLIACFIYGLDIKLRAVLLCAKFKFNMPQVIGNLPTQSDCPRPTCVVWCTASYVRVPDLDTMPERKKKKEMFCFFVKSHLKQSRVIKWCIMQLSFSVQHSFHLDSKNKRALSSVTAVLSMLWEWWQSIYYKNRLLVKGSLVNSSTHCLSSCQQQTLNLRFKYSVSFVSFGKKGVSMDNVCFSFLFNHTSDI